MVSQLTIFLENKKGRLAAACRVLGNAGINMHALSLADTADFGLVRTLCDKPEAAAAALREAGYRAAIAPVLAVRLPHAEGALASLLELLDEKDVNVEYGYCFALDGDAIDVLKINAGEELEQALVEAGYGIVKPEELYTLD